MKNLEKSKNADPSADFVLAATVLNFNFTFDIAWKVMKDILVKQMEILDFAMSSPRQVMQQAFVRNIINNLGVDGYQRDGAHPFQKKLQ